MMNSREATIAKLQKLSPSSLQTVNKFIDFLIAQQHQEAEAQASEGLSTKWEAWFAEVDKLEVSPHPPTGDYQQHLLKKHRQQGLELRSSR